MSCLYYGKLWLFWGSYSYSWSQQQLISVSLSLPPNCMYLYICLFDHCVCKPSNYLFTVYDDHCVHIFTQKATLVCTCSAQYTLSGEELISLWALYNHCLISSWGIHSILFSLSLIIMVLIFQCVQFLPEGSRVGPQGWSDVQPVGCGSPKDSKPVKPHILH